MTATALKREASFEANLAASGIKLPEAIKPVASYVPYVVTGNQVFISGQLPLGIGELSEHVGQLGRDFTLEQGNKTARVCALNVISQLRAACGGNLDRVARCVKLVVFVNSTGDFTDQPAVANGASDTMKEVFGEAGEHARSAIGVSQLPKGVAVEVEAVFELV